MNTNALPELQDTATVASTANTPLAQKMNIGVHLLDTNGRNAMAFP